MNNMREGQLENVRGVLCLLVDSVAGDDADQECSFFRASVPSTQACPAASVTQGGLDRSVTSKNAKKGVSIVYCVKDGFHNCILYTRVIQ